MKNGDDGDHCQWLLNLFSVGDNAERTFCLGDTVLHDGDGDDYKQRSHEDIWISE